MQNSKIGIAMSGGVDSTACALLLSQQFNVTGFFMQLAQPDFDQQKKNVESIANQLKIELKTIDLRDQFQQKVLDYFSNSYFQGTTPNPCVVCNREIKFGLFLDEIMSHGMDKMATGHYAEICVKDGRSRLYMGKDPKKDQSYFLSRLSQQQLSKILFPLGSWEKEETYQFVEEHGFTTFRGNESQDVCFLEESDVGKYLSTQNRASNDTGPIVTTDGKVLGRHKGVYRYTIGQRKGLGISSDAPLYVIELDARNNRVVVGKNEELFKKTITVKQIHWLAGSPPDMSKQFTVRIRYTHRGVLAHLKLQDNGQGILHFAEPQRAITPGQFSVIYDNSELLGSAIIV